MPIADNDGDPSMIVVAMEFIGQMATIHDFRLFADLVTTFHGLDVASDARISSAYWTGSDFETHRGGRPEPSYNPLGQNTAWAEWVRLTGKPELRLTGKPER